MPNTATRRISPKKLLLSKWTAVKPQYKEKHFIVSKVFLPDEPDAPVEFIELEAIYSKQLRIIPWRDFNDSDQWQQGWV